ncbi:uncharacterized protein LOC142590424 [Dermacentor variabilis]|uniref:uncharacterized protein LOC142590424 n=1 Tax=Dermacentor variabilis TaxID=34621 RepID=UPI003F5C5D47
MRLTVLGVCLLLSVTCCLCAPKKKIPAFCPLRLRDRVQVLGCVWMYLSPSLQNRLNQVMQYNRLNVQTLARFICTPEAMFSFKKLFSKPEIKEGITAGTMCLRRMMPRMRQNDSE